MTTAVIPATGLEPAPGPDSGLLDAEPLLPGETGRIDDIPAEVWTRLTTPFDLDQIEKRPQVTCWKCTDNKKNKRPETCDEHPRKARCAVCAQFITPGHIHLDYVGHAGITMRLNEVLTPAGWNWRPMAYTSNGTPLLSDGGMWILLTIGTVTRIGFGDASGKTMSPSAIKEIIGDGIRNAGMRFGIATYLWSKSNAAEQLKNLPTEPEEDYATSLAAASDMGELYQVASRLKRAVEAGAVSEALAALLRRAFNGRRADLDSEQQHSPSAPLPDDHWETPATTHPASTNAAAAPSQHQRDVTDPAAQGPPAGSGLTVIPALADVEMEPPRARGETEDFFASLTTAKSLDAVNRVEVRFTDRFNGTVINSTLFVNLVIAAAARRAELGGTRPPMSPAAAALAAILARAAQSTRSHKDVERIHALIRHHAAAGNLDDGETAELMEECKQVYRAVFTLGQDAQRSAA
ncbi:hypothetical protein KGQ20_04215 [Catenulispora sp. NF23]|uniref:Uncharacterized protein n=1 Tax=Catenulispora pinistramenti TaxID=2705254 RepID=A0ABS5KIM3_9ACTN|nr:hypothetical protein [Catenulispora pinistramenti]MBS2531969.1 hypothetical protein [Catenulispora pinistramenti]MBS2546237.1 hypothetical protein [Catenulispora pinistramenti]